MNTIAIVAVLIALVIASSVWMSLELRRRQRLAHRQQERETCEREIQEKLQSREFAVILRTKDGFGTSLETDLIGAMAARGATVYHLPGPVGDAFLKHGDYPTHHLTNDALLLLGTVWYEGGNELNILRFDHLDVRLLRRDGKVVAAGCLVACGDDAWDDLILQAMARAASALSLSAPAHTLAA